jgi:hypothetical protein
MALQDRAFWRLRELADTLEGHRYLFMPFAYSWEEADSVCKSVGGHLVTVNTKAEEELVRRLKPAALSIWLGLAVVDGRPRWIAGEQTGRLLGIWAGSEGPFAHRHEVEQWTYDSRAFAIIEWER